jgi:hypothetical protein
MKKKLIYSAKGFTATAMILVIGSVLLPRPAKALFGEEIPVLLAILAQAQQQVQQMIQQVKTMKQNLLRFGQKSYWATVGHQTLQNATRNSYGETSNWGQLLNGNPTLASSTWTAATVGVQPNVALRNEQLGNSAALANLASVEAVDGSATRCLATIAQYRADAAANRNAQMNLQSAQLDTTDGTNSEIQQLNLINAANAQAANEQRSQGNVQACLVELQTLNSKMQRDALASQMNFFTRIQHYDATEGGAWVGAAEFLNTH